MTENKFMAFLSPRIRDHFLLSSSLLQQDQRELIRIHVNSLRRMQIGVLENANHSFGMIRAL